MPVCSILLVALNLVILTGWIHGQSKIKIAIPPRIPQSGLTIQQGEVPLPTVYSFTYYIWQSINHWPKNGLLDYKQQIETFSPFITPRFKLKLIRNYNNLLNQGELQDRIRLMQGLANKTYRIEQVKVINRHSWQVTLTMHLTEMMNSNAKVVKDATMRYILRVVKFDVDAKANPWGLAVDGYISSPTRIVTSI